jgi:hypothetical protein
MPHVFSLAGIRRLIITDSAVHSAIDHDGLARDERRFFTQQEQDQACDIIFRAQCLALSCRLLSARDVSAQL